MVPDISVSMTEIYQMLVRICSNRHVFIASRDENGKATGEVRLDFLNIFTQK